MPGQSTGARAGVLVFLAGLACNPVPDAEAHSGAAEPPEVTLTPLIPAGGLEAPAPELPGVRTEGCPEGMVRVEGEYCPVLRHNCLEYHPDYLKNKDQPGVTDRCLRYAEGTRCLAKERQKLSFCMDRFEYPNRVGEKPRVLTTYAEASQMCAAQGKRLCTEHEFNFACEGPQLSPYATGSQRDARACNIDNEYIFPDHSKRMLTYEACQEDERCSAELARLDQRRTIGDNTRCASWAGVVDLNGNVGEWVHRPDQRAPHRGGLKGGWWGPVRNRCRPMTVAHPEPYYGYETGFRCCDDPG